MSAAISLAGVAGAAAAISASTARDAVWPASTSAPAGRVAGGSARTIVVVAKRTGTIGLPIESKFASRVLSCGWAGLSEIRPVPFARKRVSTTGESAKPANVFYGDQVMAKAQNIQLTMIDPLEGF